MKSNSFNRKNSYYKENIIDSKIATKTINRVARSSGFLRRKSEKISPRNLIVGFMMMVSKSLNTYSDWAIEIGLLSGITISKQALNERMNEQTKNFIKQHVEKMLSSNTPKMQTHKIKGVLRLFKNVMIDDSTTICLPDELANVFPGNVSRGKQKAQAKIHALYNLKDNSFAFLNIHSFSSNDQSLSANVLPYLNKSDLSIRDLGFTTHDVISNYIQSGIYFIARKGFNSKVYDDQSGEAINLIKLLRKKKFMDREVLLGSKEKIKVRMVALPISPEQAAAREEKPAQTGTED